MRASMGLGWHLKLPKGIIMTFEQVLKFWMKCLVVAFILIICSMVLLGTTIGLVSLVGAFIIVLAGSLVIFWHAIFGTEDS
jgi:hypothetical protein